MLEVEDINVFYGDFHVLHSVSLTVADQEAVGVVGNNGHGKSTLLKAICGLTPIRSGTIRFDGERSDGEKIQDLVERGIVYVAEDRHLFADMSVLENLNLGAYLPAARKKRQHSLELVFGLYPRLEERQSQLAGTLSGGEAQMLALGRGLMAGSRFMAIDEPSLGLAPNLVRDMLSTIVRMNEAGMTVLVVEQSLAQLEGVVRRTYQLEEGKIIASSVNDGSAPFPQVT